jgi:hypothetical protein
MLRFKAEKPYFILGMAIHGVQDTFTEEHTVRSADWWRIRNYKTYVGTKHVPSHAEPDSDKDKFVWSGHLQPEPNTKHGDYAFKTMTSNALSNMKPSALKAVEATADLIHAFEAARMAPRETETFWAQFQKKWLQLDPDPAALTNEAPDASCNVDPKETEKLRMSCLAEAGTEPDLDGTYPLFCWPKGDCHEDFAGHAIDAAKKVATAAATVLATIGSDFAKLAQEVEDFFNHAPHSYNRCYNESGDFGMRAGDHYMNLAHQKADHFFFEIGDAFTMLTLPERKTAVDAKWNDVKNALLNQAGGVRDGSCRRVREWFFRGSSKNNGENHCRDDFNQHVKNLATDLQSVYEMHINKALPESHSRAAGMTNATPQLGHNHQKNQDTLEQRYRAEHTACKAGVAQTKAAARPKRGPEDGPEPPDDSAAKLARCDLQLNAKLVGIGKPPPVPPKETDDQKRERLYHEQQACIRNPVARFNHLLVQGDRCKEMYEQAMKSAGLPLKPPDDTTGKPPIQK